MTLENRRKARRKATAEVFTPPKLVNEMLDKLLEYGKEQASGEDKTYLDPACGNGNILVEVLKRKLSLGHDPSIALSTLYGCDIMGDNIGECQLRLLAVLRDAGTKITRDHVRTVINQIIVTSLEDYKNGSLDYDYTFNAIANDEHIDAYFEAEKNKIN